LFLELMPLKHKVLTAFIFTNSYHVFHWSGDG